MAENVAEQKETMDQQEVPKEELSSAADIIQAVVKTIKAFKMYLPNNPLLQRFVEELKAKMWSHLEEYGEIKLDMDQFEFSYMGKSVYKNTDPKESMAFKMYSDGIRSLIFSEGMEEREILDFLEVIGKERPSEVDDDIVTLLWMKELPHITYILAEDYLEFNAEEGGIPPSNPQQENIKGLYKAIPPVVSTPSTPTLSPQNVVSLTEEEMAVLKEARDADEKRNPLDEVISILSSILVVEKDPLVFGEFVDIMVNLVGNLIHSGEISYSLRIIRLLRDLINNENVSSDYKGRIEKAMEGAVSGEIIKDLEGIIDTTDNVTTENLKELVSLFGKPAVKPMCELLGIVRKREMRTVILAALSEIGKESPEVFFPFLTDSRWYLARNAVLILRKIGGSSALEQISEVINHKEPRIRKEVLLYLETVPDVKAKGYILKFLQDEVSDIRIQAVRALAASKFQGALKPIIEITASKGFDERDISEKRAVFEALGDIGSDEMVPFLKDILMKKYWFNKAKEKDDAICAISGLRKVKTEAAVKALEEASAVKTDEIKAIISQAIRSITAEKAKV